jgi:hypothetical protein
MPNTYFSYYMGLVETIEDVQGWIVYLDEPISYKQSVQDSTWVEVMTYHY